MDLDGQPSKGARLMLPMFAGASLWKMSMWDMRQLIEIHTPWWSPFVLALFFAPFTIWLFSRKGTR